MKVLHKNGKVINTTPRVAKVLFLLGLASPTISPEVTDTIKQEKSVKRGRPRKQTKKEDS